MPELRHFPGSEQTIEIVLDGADTGGLLALFRLRMPPGAGAPPHRHGREAETVVVLEGELWAEVDGVERTLGPGEAVHLPQGSLHAFRADTGAVVDVIATPAGLEDFFRVACPLEAAAPPPAEDDVRAALERAGLDFSGT
ncbi:MAG TPA: cupin domain-containing protein [Gaiellaceae bacterium]|nr:cupin domain-containing protein [Gaiellaceae bacterium]